MQATPSRTRVMSEAPTPSRNGPTHVSSRSQSYSNSISTGSSVLSPPLTSSSSAHRIHKSVSMEDTPSRSRAMSTGVAGSVPFNVRQVPSARNNVQGTPAKTTAQTTPGKSPAHGTPGKSPGYGTPAKSPKVSRTPERSPQAQITPSKSHLRPVEKGQRKNSATSVIGGGRHEPVALLSESLLTRTTTVNSPPSVVNGSGPLSLANGASTLVNNDGYPWDDRDADDITLEMITDVGEGTGDEEVSLVPFGDILFVSCMIFSPGILVLYSPVFYQTVKVSLERAWSPIFPMSYLFVASISNKHCLTPVHS